ncbi:MAG TPA: hypothetical protein VK432_09095 [Stellaceae bacterium]|nr:hypothetical protein [Stellaceae bacterium]
MSRGSIVLLAGASFAAFATLATAADNNAPGAGNALAVEISGKSALVKSAKAFIDQRIAEIKDDKIRAATQDAIDNPQTCVRHRAGVDAAAKTRILDALKAAGLVDIADDGKFPGGLLAGVFPPVVDDGTDCPHLPQPFGSAPAGVWGGHHSFPGGLAVHEAFNLSSDLSLADNYRRAYGHLGAGGLPERMPADAPTGTADIAIDQDIMIGAPIWHDWAKTMVFQWAADGSEFPELNFGGNGKTDKWGTAGDSKTGAHHILSVAESMKRGLPPDFVITQASAHAAPAEGQEYKVVNWVNAAAIIDRIDPVAAGYLARDAQGRLRLPALRQLASVPIQQTLPDEPNMLVEYTLHNLSDADHTFTGTAVEEIQVVLKAVAPRFGYDPGDVAAYNTKFRNPVLAAFSAERLQILYTAGGIEAVATEIGKLKQAGVI